MQSAEIITEIEQHENIVLSDDMCCIMLDSGIYYPYSDTHRLIFDVCLVDDPKKDVCFYEDVIRNNRYGKSGYITLSKKYNDNFVSEMGYPLICMKSDIEKYKWVSIIYGFYDINVKPTYFVINIPLDVKFTEHRNYATMTVRVFADDPSDIYGSIITYENRESNGWKMCKYFIGNPIEADIEDDTEVLVPSDIMQNTDRDDIIIYDKIIELPTMNWRDAIVI